MANRATGRRAADQIQAIDCDRIQTRPQTRETIDQAKLQELIESIRRHGQQQPGAVYYDERIAAYVVVFGHRRYLACKTLGIRFECRVLEAAPTEAEIIDLQIVENELREDLNPLEKARAYERAMRAHGFDTRKQLAEHFSVADSTISLAFQILELPEEGQRRIEAGENVKRVLRDFEAKPRRKKGHGKRRTLSLGGGRTLVLVARKPVEDELAYQMLTAAIATLPVPELRLADVPAGDLDTAPEPDAPPAIAEAA